MNVMGGIMLSLVIALSVSGWLLKKSWQDNATLEANALQYQETIEGMAADYDKLERDAALSEVIVVDNVKMKAPIIQVREKIKYVIREVQKEVPVDDCLNQPMPDAIFECLSNGSCGGAQGEGKGVSAGGAATGNP